MLQVYEAEREEIKKIIIIMNEIKRQKKKTSGIVGAIECDVG